MTDFTGMNYKNLIMNFKKVVIEQLKPWHPDGLECVDKETFLKDNKGCESIFAKLDFNNDGYITKNEYNALLIMDIDQDGVISESENEGNKKRALEEVLFFARRNIDKWFTIDIDRDGQWSNVEKHLAKYRMAEDDPLREHQLDASMTNEQLAKKYNKTEKVNNFGLNLQRWMNIWARVEKKVVQDQFGVELSEADMVKVKKEMIKQLNTWLFKTGDNATHDAPLYQSLNIDSYTRLKTRETTISCCGGNIIPPPSSNDKNSCNPVFMAMEWSPEDFENREKEIQEFITNVQIGDDMSEEDFDKYRQEEISKIEKKYEPYNTSEEVHNRLAWAIYPEPQRAREIQKQIDKERLKVEKKVKSGKLTQEEADKINWSIWARMSDEEYAQSHEQYMKIRNMSAADFRELLKPENEEAKLKFEENSNMTVRQIVQYIDIVESVTGTDFDSPDWQIDAKQFLDIGYRVDDTQDDANLLEGKTRKDIPENRQELLKFLEEKGWLYEQFKI